MNTAIAAATTGAAAASTTDQTTTTGAQTLGADPAGTTQAAPIVEIDGQPFTEQQLQEAVEAYQNRQNWQRAYTQRDQVLAEQRKQIETALAAIQQQQAKPDASKRTLQTPEDWQTYIREEAVKQASEIFQRQMVAQRFLTAHPEFPVMQADGRIGQFMAANPGYDEVAAYYELKLRGTTASVEGARADGQRAALQSIQQKGGVRVLTGSGSSMGTVAGSQPDMAKLTPGQLKALALKDLETGTL